MSIDTAQFLKSLCKEGVSDIHLKVDSPPKVRLNGELLPVKHNPLSREIIEKLTFSLLNERQKGIFTQKYEVDFSYSIDELRFRINAFRQQGNCSLVLRLIPPQVPSIENLRLPAVVKNIALEHRGLVLVTGVTGSGKSTTLAAMINLINNTRKKHVLTIEDPIEFIFKDKLSSINQRELGLDTFSFPGALRSALRQDPDVIMVGEMRDMETISIALRAAETGHIVFSTLHTTDAAGTVNRTIDTFPAEQQNQVRLQLSENLKAVISQRLLPKKDGNGRIVAAEIMVATTTTKSYIAEPEKTAKLKEAIEAGKSQYGMQSFDQALTELYKMGEITFEVAMANATSPSDFQRALQFD